MKLSAGQKLQLGVLRALVKMLEDGFEGQAPASSTTAGGAEGQAETAEAVNDDDDDLADFVLDAPVVPLGQPLPGRVISSMMDCSHQQDTAASPMCARACDREEAGHAKGSHQLQMQRNHCSGRCVFCILEQCVSTRKGSSEVEGDLPEALVFLHEQQDTKL